MAKDQKRPLSKSRHKPRTKQEDDSNSMDIDLFESSGSELLTDEDDSELTGMELFLKRKETESHGIGYFSIKHTVSLCYLGLLYTKQNVLVSDLSK